MTQTDLAKLVGCSRNHINHLVKQGKLTKLAEGPEAALKEYATLKDVSTDVQRQWAKKQKELAAQGKHHNQKKKAKTPASVDDDESPDIPDDGTEISRLYNRSRAKEKKYAAMLRELDYKIQSGEYIHVDEVRADADRALSALVSMLASMPSRIAPKLMQRDNLAEIQIILENGINEAKQALLESKFGKINLG